MDRHRPSRHARRKPANEPPLPPGPQIVLPPETTPSPGLPVDLTADDLPEHVPEVAPEELLRQVNDVFPDICPAHVEKLAREHFLVVESVIAQIAGALEEGKGYPKNSALGKRKRQSDPIREILAKQFNELEERDIKRLAEYFEGPTWEAIITKDHGYREAV
jgi:hypothetical protein